MYIEPNTTLKILRDVPLDTTYNHSFYFADKYAQTEYFISKTKYTLDKLTYQRANRGYIKVELTADLLYDCNYLMFQNTNFGNKWFYAFITGVEYISNNTSQINYEIDDMMTWEFDYSLRECFVEREHAMDDSIGANTVPEKLETGTLVNDGISYPSLDGLDDVLSDMVIVLAATFRRPAEGEAPSVDTYKHEFYDNSWSVQNGYFSGLYYSVFENDLEGWRACGKFIDEAIDDGKEDGIVTLFMCPRKLVQQGITTTFPKINISKSKGYGSFQGYTPRNNKLYTYPYNYLKVSNFQGGENEYPYELFSSTSCNFLLTGDCSPSASAMLIPLSYKGSSTNYDEMASLGGFPQLSYNTDAFKAWLAQNSAKWGLGTIGTLGAAAAVATFATGGLALAPIAVVGIAGAVGTKLGETYTQSKKPNKYNSGGGNTSLAAIRKLTFGFTREHLRAEYAKIIDDYFTMFGYATLRTKVPNTHGRPHWNYVKTVGAVITGSIPSDAERHICEIFDKGITLWKNPSEVGNYSLNNK